MNYIGRVLARAWEYLRTGFIQYIVAYLVIWAASAILVVGLFAAVLFLVAGGVFGSSAGSDDLALLAGLLGTLPGIGLLLLVFLGFWIVSIFQTGALVEVSAQVERGYRPDAMVAFRWVAHRFWRYAGVSILSGLLMGFFVGGAAIIAFIFGPELGEDAVLQPMHYLLFTGSLLPALLLGSLFSLVYYLVARENLGVFAVFGRSARLVKRAYWPTVFFLGVVGFVQIGFSFGSDMINTLLPGSLFGAMIVFGLGILSMIVSFTVGLSWPAILSSLYIELIGQAAYEPNQQ